MQSKERDFFALVAEQNKRNEKARVIKAYRTIKEYYPWNVLAIPLIFPIIGFFVFMKAASDISKQIRFAGGFYLFLALLFVGIGVLFSYAHISDFASCKRCREERETAENRGKRYHGTILGYKVNVAGVIPGATAAETPKIRLNYILEVEYLEDTKYKTIETVPMRYHPNAVLMGSRCDVCIYEGERYVCNFELRTGLKDGTAEIPQKGMGEGVK